MSSSDTIFALSSGAPPAALAVIRISGPAAGETLSRLAGRLPAPRRASLARLRGHDGLVLDQALILWFPGPDTATGENLAELHLHGGRAVVRAVEAELGRLPGLRMAEPGEFTRRAFANGRMDLNEAEGLGDLLTAETELQRRAALGMAGGSFSREVETWQAELLRLSALIEAELDFSDEDDVAAGMMDAVRTGLHDLAAQIGMRLRAPSAERLRDGIRVVLAGPPNAGKSSLINALARRDAAIVSPVAGTTRDVIEVPLALDGRPFVFADTAGLHTGTGDAIEAIGMERARSAIAEADLILWLGAEGQAPEHPDIWEIASRSDAPDHVAKGPDALSLSPHTGQGMACLVERLIAHADQLCAMPDGYALSQRQRSAMERLAEALDMAVTQDDLLLMAENVRTGLKALDQLTGRAGTEAMLDTLFGRFCIGK